jgi:2-amino-4-hydroxy-6-hydroxymethyldihydropteridine diphosphokinase
MKKAFLGIGSNLGDRLKSLKDAKDRIEESIGSVILASSVYETDPWGFESDEKFLNMVLCVETILLPSGLLGRILMIESQLGRIRSENLNRSREIDIDILLYDNEIVNDAAIVVPHPRMHERRFVLVPLVEIAPSVIHPVLNKSAKSLLKSCKDNNKVRKYI